MSKTKIPPPPEISSVEAYALQAVATGKATPEQQRQAMHVIANRLCNVGEDYFDPDPYIHAKNSGKASIAKAIAKLIMVETIKKIEAYEKIRRDLGAKD